jgi:hypothetical protein
MALFVRFQPEFEGVRSPWGKLFLNAPCGFPTGAKRDATSEYAECSQIFVASWQAHC